MENKMKTTSTIAGLVFVGSMFVGLGLGLYFHMTVIGLFIGMGVGFLGMGIVYALLRNK